MASKKRLVVLKKRSEFLRLSKDGKRLRLGGWLVVNYLPNELGSFRCGWTLPRKIGTAVMRNRLKRWSRVFLRERLSEAGEIGADVNLVFLKRDDDFYRKLGYDEFSEQMDRAWELLRKRL